MWTRKDNMDYDKYYNHVVVIKSLHDRTSVGILEEISSNRYQGFPTIRINPPYYSGTETITGDIIHSIVVRNYTSLYMKLKTVKQHLCRRINSECYRLIHSFLEYEDTAI